MSEGKLLTYQEVIAHLNSKKRVKHLLLGNGFSMSYDRSIFSYNALSKFIDKLEDETLKKLFKIINTNNFELLMRQLDAFAEIAAVFNVDHQVIETIHQASTALKNGLIDAIQELHPEHVYKIPEEKSKACSAFLSEFLNGGNVFTANYDLLMYWVLMRNETKNAIDGFGKDAEETDEFVPYEDRNYSELRWGKNKHNQNIHYLHGALPLFDTGIEIEKETYTNDNYLLDNIKKRLAQKEYPIFITAGNSHDKLENILHNRYLAFCYDRLCSIEGSLITFGFNFGEYDEHIIEAINKAAKFTKNSGRKSALLSIYIGVYSEQDKEHIMSIKQKFKCQKVELFDAKTVAVWENATAIIK